MTSKEKTLRKDRKDRALASILLEEASADVTYQAVEKTPSASLLQKIQNLAYEKYASILNFFCASHLTFFEQPVILNFSTTCYGVNGKVTMKG